MNLVRGFTPLCRFVQIGIMERDPPLRDNSSPSCRSGWTYPISRYCCTCVQPWDQRRWIFPLCLPWVLSGAYESEHWMATKAHSSLTWMFFARQVMRFVVGRLSRCSERVICSAFFCGVTCLYRFIKNCTLAHHLHIIQHIVILCNIIRTCAMQCNNVPMHNMRDKWSTYQKPLSLFYLFWLICGLVYSTAFRIIRTHAQ
jgi:hypothetical protein